MPSLTDACLHPKNMFKSSDEYLHVENQSQISLSTEIEDYRILKPDRPRAIWCFNSKMSQAAYITDTSQLMQSRD